MLGGFKLCCPPHTSRRNRPDSRGRALGAPSSPASHSWHRSAHMHDIHISGRCHWQIVCADVGLHEVNSHDILFLQSRFCPSLGSRRGRERERGSTTWIIRCNSNQSRMWQPPCCLASMSAFGSIFQITSRVCPIVCRQFGPNLGGADDHHFFNKFIIASLKEFIGLRSRAGISHANQSHWLHA